MIVIDSDCQVRERSITVWSIADGYPLCEFTDGSGQSADGSDLQKGWNSWHRLFGMFIRRQARE